MLKATTILGAFVLLSLFAGSSARAQQACTSDADCNQSYMTKCLNGWCSPPNACLDNSDCSGGQVCEENQCVSDPYPNGEGPCGCYPPPGGCGGAEPYMLPTNPNTWGSACYCSATAGAYPTCGEGGGGTGGGGGGGTGGGSSGNGGGVTCPNGLVCANGCGEWCTNSWPNPSCGWYCL